MFDLMDHRLARSLLNFQPVKSTPLKSEMKPSASAPIWLAGGLEEGSSVSCMLRNWTWAPSDSRQM